MRATPIVPMTRLAMDIVSSSPQVPQGSNQRSSLASEPTSAERTEMPSEPCAVSANFGR